MKRVRNAIIAVLILAVGIIGLKQLGGRSQKGEIKEEKAKMRVRTMMATLDTIDLPLTVYGKLTAAQRADLFAEVTGTFKTGDKPFLEGTSFSKGAIMLQLDDAEAKANAMSAKGNFINALLGVLPDLNQDYSADYDRFLAYYEGTSLNKPLQAMPKAEGKLEKFLIARGIQSAFFAAKSAEERLDKFAVRAPFTGVVAQANVKPGNLVSPGKALGSFVSTSKYELKTAVTLSYADQLALGQEVHFSSPDIEGDWTGTISRIAPVVDAATQSIQVIIAISGDRLREGMYLTGTIDGLQVKNALKIPASMVFDNEFVYTIVQDSVLDKTAVEVVEWLDDEIIIKGLESGTRMVNEPTLKAAAGLVVEPIK